MRSLQDFIISYPVIYTGIIFLLSAVVGPMLNTVGQRLGIEFNDLVFGGRPKPDYEKEDEEDEWAVYQLAFLIHDKDPPPWVSISSGEYQWPTEVEKLWRQLRYAVDNGDLDATLKMKTWYVEEGEIKRYCKEKGWRPPFLFPEER